MNSQLDTTGKKSAKPINEITSRNSFKTQVFLFILLIPNIQTHPQLYPSYPHTFGYKRGLSVLSLKHKSLY